MRGRAVSILLMLALLAVASLQQPVNALSKPVYPPRKYPEMVPDLIAVYGDKILVHSLSDGSVQLIDPETGEARGFKAWRELADLVVLGGWLAIAPHASQRLAIYDLESGESREMELPGVIEDLEACEPFIWATIPHYGLVVAVDPSKQEIVKRLSLDVAHGRDKISMVGGTLWAISKSGTEILKVDLETSSETSMSLKEKALTIKAFKGGVVVATAADEILEISNDLKITGSWKLEKGSTTGIQLYRLEDGRIIYVSLPRWTIGEIEGERITEVKAGARIGGSALAEDRVWFTEPTKRRIGYAPLSRPPIVKDFRVEKVRGNLFKAIAEVEDPDEDLSRVVLIVFYPELVGVAQNRSYEMEYADGLYVKEFSIEYGRRVEVRVSAIDAYNNLGRSSVIKLRAEKVEETVSSQQTSKPSPQQSVTPAEVYAVGSSLLLLIPILAALMLHRRRRKKRRRR